MHGVRTASVVGVIAVAVALAGLAGSVTKGRAAGQTATVAPVLTGFATGVLQTVAGGIRDEAIAAGFESLLGFIGLGEEQGATSAQVSAIDERVMRVEEALHQATATINETKRNVDAARVDIDKIKDTTLRSAYSQAAQEAFDIVHSIDNALRKTEAANAAPIGHSGNPTRTDAENYISEHIDGAAEKLRVVVFGDPNGNFGGTPLMDAAFSVATGNDLLNHAESVHLRYLVTLYTTYESLAAAVTAEYRRSRPGYGDQKTYLNNWIATIKSQEDGRREAVPAGAVVDARSLKMWATTPARTRNPLSPGRIAGPGSYTDWAIPSVSRYESLYAGYATTPKNFLHNHGFDVTQGHVVVTNQKRGNYTACQPTIATLDLSGNPPPIGTAYGADTGACKPGTHGGATTFTRCVKKPTARGGMRDVCSTQTDEQQVAYNNRKFGTSDLLFFPVRPVAAGSFLPPSYTGS